MSTAFKINYLNDVKINIIKTRTFTEEITRPIRRERIAITIHLIVNTYIIEKNECFRKKKNNDVNNHIQQSLETYTLTLMR